MSGLKKFESVTGLLATLRNMRQNRWTRLALKILDILLLAYLLSGVVGCAGLQVNGEGSGWKLSVKIPPHTQRQDTSPKSVAMPAVASLEQ